MQRPEPPAARGFLGRLTSISRGELADHTLTPGEAAEILAELRRLELSERRLLDALSGISGRATAALRVAGIGVDRGR